jgi:outer membrane lipoprotein-sorting protein
MLKIQLLVVGIVAVIIAVVVIVSGLYGGNQDVSTDESGVYSSPPTAESVQGMLDKAAAIDSLYYEVTMTMIMPQYGTQTTTMKIWQEKPYFKQQMTVSAGGMINTVSVIQRPDGVFLYDAAQGKYVLTTNVPSYTTSLQYFDSTMIKNLLNNQSVMQFETETLDGKISTTFEYTLSFMGMNMTTKIWIWNEKGLPLKAHMVMTMEQMTTTIDMIFSNYSFADIPDSTFDVT